MRDDFLQKALEIIPNPNELINVVSRRVKQLKNGTKPLVESFERLSYEDIALKEIYEGQLMFIYI